MVRRLPSTAPSVSRPNSSVATTSRDSAATSTPAAARRTATTRMSGRVSTPSASASAISWSWASAVSRSDGMRTTTRAAPRRSAERAASIATLSPPITTTLGGALVQPTQVDVTKEGGGVLDVLAHFLIGRSCTRKIEGARFRLPHSEEDGVVLADELVNRLHSRTRAYVDPRGADEADFAFEQIAGDLVFRESHGEHAAELWHCFEERYVVAAAAGEVVDGGETRRTRADDGHALPRRRGRGGTGPAGAVFGRGALDGVDRDWRFHDAAAAPRLAGAVTDQAADHGEGDSLAHRSMGLGEPAFGDVAHVARHIDLRRAGGDARGDQALVFLELHRGTLCGALRHFASVRLLNPPRGWGPEGRAVREPPLREGGAGGRRRVAGFDRLWRLKGGPSPRSSPGGDPCITGLNDVRRRTLTTRGGCKGAPHLNLLPLGEEARPPGPTHA